MKIKHVNIPTEVMDVLRRSEVDSKSLRLPPGQLERSLYEQVNKVIVAVGGKWNRGSQSHLFSSDPREALGLALETGKAVNQKQTFQFFPTPKEIARRMVKLAGVQKGHRILEPSAGLGAILSELPGDTCRVAVEINPEMADKLHIFGEVRCADFLTINGELGMFDRVIMNPPFTGGQDIKHITHAMTMLKPGGRLVAICANGPKQREYFSIASEWIDLEPGAFKESGTGVNAAMVVIDV